MSVRLFSHKFPYASPELRYAYYASQLLPTHVVSNITEYHLRCVSQQMDKQIIINYLPSYSIMEQ